MAKVTMPEPSAEITSMNNVTVFDLTAHGKRRGLSVGEKFITTTQAEAYANARVREALEEAIVAVESCRTTGTIRYGTVSDCIEAIRALLPSTPARPESE